MLVVAVFWTLKLYIPAIRGSTPRIITASAGWKQSLLAACDTLRRPYFPLLWCPFGLPQSILANYVVGGPAVQYTREILTTSDGGTIALDWAVSPKSQSAAAAAASGHRDDSEATVVIFPGFGNSAQTRYIRSVVHRLITSTERRYSVAVAVFRGYDGLKLTSPQYHNLSSTADVAHLITHARAKATARQHARPNVYGIGFSLGANYLLKYVGDSVSACGVDAALCYASPYNLMKLVTQHDQRNGATRPHQRMAAAAYRALESRSARFLKSTVADNRSAFSAQIDSKRFDYDAVMNASSVKAFSSAFSAPLYGFPSYAEYYQTASSEHSIAGVMVPTVCISACDDPIVTETCIPDREVWTGNRNVALITTERGGHLGWLTGVSGRQSWMVDSMEQLLAALHAQTATASASAVSQCSADRATDSKE